MHGYAHMYVVNLHVIYSYIDSSGRCALPVKLHPYHAWDAWTDGNPHNPNNPNSPYNPSYPVHHKPLRIIALNSFE